MGIQDRSNSKSTQVNRTGRPIYRLPEELLVYVFRIIAQHNPFGIGRLLFVSQYWYIVIRNTPSLWSRIRIAPRISSDILKYTQYTMVALANSVNHLLDVTVDLHLYTYLDERGQKVPRMSLSALDEVQFTTLFQAVVGSDGSSMARWRSFRVRVPGKRFDVLFGPSSVFGQFMRGLRYPTPHLESLFIRLQFSDEYFTNVGGPLQELQHLKILVVDAGGHLGYLKYIPGNIEALCFRLWGSTKVMSPFSNLRHLSILSIPNRSITHEDDPVIVFPLLESLTLEVQDPGRVFNPAKVLTRKINAPLLDTLCLLGENAIWAMAEPTAFRHVGALDLLSHDKKPESILKFIDENLSGYTTLTSLTVCPWHLEDVMKALRSLKDQGRAPVDLDTIYTIISDNEGLLLDHSSVESVIILGRLASEYLYRSHLLSGDSGSDTDPFPPRMLDYPF